MITLFVLFMITLVLAVAGLLYLGLSVAWVLGKILIDALWLGFTLVMGLGKLALVVAIVIGFILFHLFSGLFIGIGVIALAILAAWALVSFFSADSRKQQPVLRVASQTGRETFRQPTPSEERMARLLERFDRLERRLNRLNVSTEEGR